MRASHREGYAGPRTLRAAHRPAGAGGQLRGSPLHGLLSRPGRAPRPLLSSAKPSLTLAAVLHLATSGVSWLGRGRPRPGSARGSPSRPSGAVAAAGQTPERSGAGGAEPAAAERCVCRACLSAYSIARLPPGTEFLRWFLGSAPVKGSSYFRALSISICCPYLQRLALCWLEFQVINVTVTSLLGVLSLLAVPPTAPLFLLQQRSRQAGRDKGLSSTWAVLLPAAAAWDFPALRAAASVGSGLIAVGCVAEV